MSTSMLCNQSELQDSNSPEQMQAAIVSDEQPVAGTVELGRRKLEQYSWRRTCRMRLEGEAEAQADKAVDRSQHSATSRYRGGAVMSGVVGSRM